MNHNKEPFKVYVKDYFDNDKLKKIVYFFSTLPDEISVILEKLNVNKKLTDKDENALSDYFGDWKKVLGISDLNKSSMQGGEELIDSDSDDFDFGNEEDVKIITNLDKIDEINYDKLVHYETKVGIFKTDTIYEIRKKIYLVIGIPVYRQLILSTQNLGIDAIYEVLNHSKVKVKKDLKEKSKLIKYISDIPIDTTLSDAYQYIVTRMVEELNYIIITKEIVIFDLDFAKKQMNISSLQVDKYQRNLIYYGFIKKFFPIMSYSMFVDYLVDEALVISKYPLINQPQKELARRFELQKEIEISIEIPNKIEDFFNEHITESTNSFSFKILSSDVEEILYIRNIFDSFSTDDTIYCISISNKEGSYVVSKYNTILSEYEIRELNNDISVDNAGTIIYFVYYNEGVTQKFGITTAGNCLGNLNATNSDQSIDEILKSNLPIINKYIDKINTLESIFKSQAKSKIKKITKENIILQNISMEYKWKKNLSRENFIKLDPVVEKYLNAGIVRNRPNVYQKNAENYLLRYARGMSINNSTTFIIKKEAEHTNYYQIFVDESQYLIYENRFIGCIFNITNKVTYVSFSFENMDSLLLINAKKYVTNMIIDMDNVKTEQRKIKPSNVNAKKKMEELDPELYDFDINGVKYSRICQKKFRPIGVYTEEEYIELDKKGKNLYEFINYTTKEPLYYECGAKLPYFSFIANKHPKNYCIPRCRETKISGEKNKRVKEKCMSLAIVEEEKVDNSNVIKFGKTLDNNRFSFMHESFYKVLKLDKNSYLVYRLEFDYETSNYKYLKLYSLYKGIDFDKLIVDILAKLKPELFQSLLLESSITFGTLVKIIKNIKTVNSNFVNVIKGIIYLLYKDIIISAVVNIYDQKEILNKSNSSIDLNILDIINLNEVNQVVVFIHFKDEIMPIVYNRSISNPYPDEFLAAIKKYKATEDKKLLGYSEFNSYVKLKHDSNLSIVKIFISGGHIINLIAKYKNGLICIGVVDSPLNMYDGKYEESYESIKRKEYNLPAKNILDYISDKTEIDKLVFLCNTPVITSFEKSEDKVTCNFIGFRIKDTYFWFNDTTIKEIEKYISADKIKIEFVAYDIDKTNQKLLKGNIEYYVISDEERINFFYRMHIYTIVKKEVFRLFSFHNYSTEDHYTLVDLVTNDGKIIDRLVKLLIKKIDKLDINKESNFIFSQIKVKNVKTVNLIPTEIETERVKSVTDNIFYQDGKILVLAELIDDITNEIKNEFKTRINVTRNLYDTDVYIIRDQFKFNLIKGEKIIIYYI